MQLLAILLLEKKTGFPGIGVNRERFCGPCVLQFIPKRGRGFVQVMPRLQALVVSILLAFNVNP